MRYEVWHRCGHGGTIELSNGLWQHEREDRLAALRRTVCKNCLLALEYERAAESAGNLPPLTGSEVQRKWATTIRWKLLGECDAFIALRQTTVQETERWVELREKLCAQTSAGWWIDRRDDSPRSLITEIATGSSWHSRARNG